MPASLEDYVQEAGRIGRDGCLSHAIVYVHRDSNKGPHISTAVKTYTSTNECLRRKLMNYFNEEFEPLLPALCCSICYNSALSSGCCPCNYKCKHDFSTTRCYCVKWCHGHSAFLPAIDAPGPSQVTVSLLRQEMSDAAIATCRQQLIQLAESSSSASTLPSNLSAQVYCKLIDNVLSNYQHIGSTHDILDQGAYSHETAQFILDILDDFAPIVSSTILETDDVFGNEHSAFVVDTDSD